MAIAPSATAADAPVRGDETEAGQYSVLYCEHFEVGDGAVRVSLCVRWFPAAKPGSRSERFEAEVRCQLGTAAGRDPSLPDAAAGLRKPVLVWDAWESVAFDWLPPAVPTSGRHELDGERQCVVSHFVACRPNTWAVKLAWTSDSGLGRSHVPLGLHARIQIQDDASLHQKCFEVPIRVELEGTDEAKVPWPQGERAEVAELRETREEITRIRNQRRQLEKDASEADQRIAEVESQMSLLPAPDAIADLEAQIREEVAHRRICQEELMNLRGRIRIFCRIRGLRPDEGPASACLRESRTEVSLPSVSRNFEFDLVFGPETQTADIWEEVWPLVDSVYDQPGTHACVMAYGQTGAGKTFTMEGSSQQHGLIRQTVEHLFSRTADATWRTEASVKIELSMIEIYQEQLFDLFDDQPEKRLILRNDGSEGGPEVKGLRLETPQSAENAVSLYQVGMRQRRLGVSERNSRSSRSHTVFCLHIRRHDPASGELMSTSKISLVDLAGSERQSSSSAFDKTRVREASFINQSLTTLGKVTQACIGRGSSRPSERANCHVPYRDSVLTQLLSDSIGGQAKTLIIVHVTPHAEDLQESCCTLQFAVNAACVQERSAYKGEEDVRRQFARLSADNARLRGELHSLVGDKIPAAPLLEDARGRPPLARGGGAAQPQGSPKAAEAPSSPTKCRDSGVRAGEARGSPTKDSRSLESRRFLVGQSGGKRGGC